MNRVADNPDRGLPHPPGRLPLLGDLLTVNPTKPAQGAMRDARRLGPIFERRIATYPVVVVSGIDLIHEINDEKHWRKHVGVVFRKLRPVVRDGLFTAYNDEPNWAKAHNILVPAFTQSAMRGYHATMVETVGELIDYWSARQGQWIDPAQDTNRFTLEVIARAGFGRSFDSFTKVGAEEHPIVGAMNRSLEYIIRSVSLPPLLQKTLGHRRAVQHAKDVAYAEGLLDEIIADRKRDPEPGRHHDLLARMLTDPDPATGTLLDEVNIRHQILTFVVAGHETSAGVLAFAMYFLANHPDVARRAREEVDARWPGRDRPDIVYEDVARMRYLRRIVDETLRLWPVAPGYFREARHDITIGDGRYHFGMGDWVFVLTLQAHRDPVWGDDPDSFDPDRFLPENLRALGRHIYKPFGTGERACIGRQFAYHELLLALAHIVHAFDIEPEPGYRLTVREQLTLKPKGLRLKLHPRR